MGQVEDVELSENDCPFDNIISVGADVPPLESILFATYPFEELVDVKARFLPNANAPIVIETDAQFIKMLARLPPC